MTASAPAQPNGAESRPHCFRSIISNTLEGKKTAWPSTLIFVPFSPPGVPTSDAGSVADFSTRYSLSRSTRVSDNFPAAFYRAPPTLTLPTYLRRSCAVGLFSCSCNVHVSGHAGVSNSRQKPSLESRRRGGDPPILVGAPWYFSKIQLCSP